VKVAVVAPAATVTLAGTVAALVALDDNVTTNPPVGAGLEIVTVPVSVDPPRTDGFAKVTVVTVGAVTVKVAFAVEPFTDAVIVEVEFAPTASVLIAKLAEFEPAAIVTVAGTVTLARLDCRLTV